MKKTFKGVIRCVKHFPEENITPQEEFTPFETLEELENLATSLYNDDTITDIKVIDKEWTIEAPKNRCITVYIHRKSLNLISRSEYNPEIDAMEILYIC